MKEYLYLPFSKCKNCKHLDASSSREYNCDSTVDCPATEVEIVVKNSVTELVNRYRKAVSEMDLTTVESVLSEVFKRGSGFTYKFKQELSNETGKK
jgi:hypothetical protein